MSLNICTMEGDAVECPVNHVSRCKDGSGSGQPLKVRSWT